MDEDCLKHYPLFEDITEEALDDNSNLKKMLRLVGNNKRVIDFGCATGYFAQLLNKNGCSVTGVEINPDAAKVAEQHCKEVIVADLDFVSISEILGVHEFDVAVFGDVLEHLRNPWRVLQETRNILKKEGYVVASIPNIAHGAIRLALLQGRFEYMDLGILDSTHLRFFTKKTIQDMLEKSGYLLNVIDRTKLEIFSGINLIPQVNNHDFNDEILKFIEEDEEVDTLQFIVQALPATLEGKYLLLNERYSSLSEKSEHTNTQLQQTQAELGNTQLQLQQTQAELGNTQLQLQQTQAELEQLRNAVLSIEASNFSKLRIQWHKLKKLVSSYLGWNNN